MTTLRTVDGRSLSAADRDHVANFSTHVHDAQLPEEVRDGVTALLNLVAEGRDVAVVDAESPLTPNEAARIVGVSRPLLNELLDDGRIPFFETPGGHRKIKLGDVRAYIERRDAVAAELAAARAARRPDGEVIADEMQLDAETARILGFT